jgi:glucokinase
MGDTPFLLVLDFGGTKHTAALADANAGARPWLDLRRQTAPPGSSADADMETMRGLWRELLAAHSGRLVAIGVSFGGPVDFARGVVRLSHHVPGWANWPLRDQLQAEFGVPVSVDNDANAGALGEWRFGAGRGCASLLYLTVSTGVGGGWVLEGRVHRGADSMAGEIGHTIVDPNGPVCICGRRGCVEILACGPAIARRARERLNAEPNAGAILRRLIHNDLAALTAEQVSRAAMEGDALAEAALLAAARDLGTGIGNALSLMNPQRVVLGGGVTKSGAAWWAEVRRAARANTLPEISAASRIVPAALGDYAPLWGALALAEELPGKC